MDHAALLGDKFMGGTAEIRGRLIAADALAGTGADGRGGSAGTS